MKKAIFVFVAGIFLSLVSCDSDENNDTGPVQDKLVGSWKLTKEFEDGEELESEPCDLETTQVVKADGTLVETNYEEDAKKKCIVNKDDILSFKWQRVNETAYKLTPTGSMNKEVIEAKITFMADTFTMEFTDKEDNTKIKEIYKRIK